MDCYISCGMHSNARMRWSQSLRHDSTTYDARHDRSKHDRHKFHHRHLEYTAIQTSEIHWLAKVFRARTRRLSRLVITLTTGITAVAIALNCLKCVSCLTRVRSVCSLGLVSWLRSIFVATPWSAPSLSLLHTLSTTVEIKPLHLQEVMLLGVAAYKVHAGWCVCSRPIYSHSSGTCSKP